MFVTPLNFTQVLERFYHQDKYDFMLLFASSFDGNDRTIIHEIVDNAKRIDRITGDRICFFYFIKDSYDNMNEKITRWVRDVSDWTPLYGEGVTLTMETADDICRHFAILRSNLPAFILVDKDRREEPQIFSIHDYLDFESFLTPLNIIHSYVEDKESIRKLYEQERRRGVVTQDEVDKRNEQRKSWSIALQQLERKKMKELSLGLNEQADKRESEMLKFERKLEDFPVIEARGIDESIPYPHDKLQHIKNIAIEKLNITLNSYEGESIIENIQNQYKYSDSVLKIWQLVRTKGIRLSRILEKIRFEIHHRGFDVFISCKSQDYGLAHELYDFLLNKGFKPFLADSSIKEIGIDQYTALIGEVINVCQNMVVFATDIRYLETPYVAAEWHTFINDINTGHKPNAKIVCILSTGINPHNLPIWLRDKQCLTTENYKEDLISFLSDCDNETIELLKEEMDRAYFLIKSDVKKLLWHHPGNEVENMAYRFMNYVERSLQHIVSRFDNYRTFHNYSYDVRKSELAELRARVRHTRKEWEEGFRQLAKDIEQYIGNDEVAYHEAIHESSTESIKRYLELFPHGFHYREAIDHLKCLSENMRKMDSAPISFSPSTEMYSNDYRRSDDECLGTGAAVGRALPMILGGHIGAILGGIGALCGIKTNKVEKYDEVYSSIFAPSEVKRKSHMLIQVYLHLFEETEKVKILAKESQKGVERRDYIPLQCKLKKGDKVDVHLNIYGETLLMSDKKSVVWQGSYTKCGFDYFVPKDIDIDELSCVALLSVNGMPVGEMRFITQIVEQPRLLNSEIIAHKYNKVFISYSHQDESRVKFLHEGLELGSVPHFFDRKYLKAGDVFPQVIQDYINSADLFILCWSENASKSEYVQKERLQALERAFPQVQPEKAAKLRIYPMSIDPHAELPSDMKEYYHFGEI